MAIIPDPKKFQMLPPSMTPSPTPSPSPTPTPTVTGSFDPKKFGATPTEPPKTASGSFDPNQFGASLASGSFKPTGNTAQDAINYVNGKLQPQQNPFLKFVTNFVTNQAPTGASPYETGNVFTAPLASYNEAQGLPMDIGKALLNVPTSFARLVRYALDPNTYIGIGKAAAGGIESIPGIKEWYDAHATQTGKETLAENRDAFKSFVDQVNRQYGSVENIKRSLVEDPVGSYLAFRGAVEGSEYLAKKAGMPGTAEAISKFGEKATVTNLVKSSADMYKAITAKTPAELDKYIQTKFEKGVRPTVVGKTGSLGQLAKYQDQAVSVVKDIAANKESLRLTDPYGETIAGKVPKSLNEFAQAVDQGKARIFAQYDAMQKAAGVAGAKVDLSPIASELDKIAADPVMQDLHPEVADYASKRAEALMNRGSYTTDQGQVAIENLNKSLQSFYKNPSFETANKAAVDAMIANQLRSGLDGAIEAVDPKLAGDPTYQDLKRQYGAYKAIEKDVLHRSIVDARKNVKGLIDFTDVFSAAEVVKGLTTMDPSSFASAAAIKGIAKYIKYLNDPNTSIKKMFQAADKGPTAELPTPPKVGLSIENVSKKGEGGIPTTTKEKTPSPQEFQVGITNVAGRFKVQSDAIVAEAKALYDEGKFPEAQAKYKEAVKFGVKTINDAFQGTGIKVKTIPGFGVFDGTIEPNVDMSAIVPKGKEDLFHYKLAELGDTALGQKSILTYRGASSDILGAVGDPAKKIYNEPMASFSLKTKAGVADAQMLYDLMKKNDIIGGSIKNGGKTLDIVNLTHYNADYEAFSKKLINLENDLNGRGLLDSSRRGTAESRLIGSDEENAPITYKSVRDQFTKENPEFKSKGTKASQEVTSKVLERLPTKATITKAEIEQMLKSPDISAAEKQAATDTLAKMKGDTIKTADFASKMRQGFFKIKPETTDRYASYGTENLNMDTTDHQTILLKTDVTHGISGHFGAENELGHVRTFKASDNPKEIFVSEIQSDPFQRGVDLVPEKKMAIRRQIEDQLQADYMKKNDIDTLSGIPTDDLRKMGDQATKIFNEKFANKSQSLLSSQEKQFQSLASDNKYRKAQLEATLVTLRDKGYTEINLPTPSTVAKIEWGMGGSEAAAPYLDYNGDYFSTRADDLSHGDQITYADEKYTVVDTPERNDEIIVAPSDKVRSFRWSDYVSDEGDNEWSNAKYDLNRYTEKTQIPVPKEISPSFAKQLIDYHDAGHAGSFNSFYLRDTLGKIAEGDKAWTLQDLEEDVYNKAAEYADMTNLQGIYGKDNVFSHELGRGYDSQIYVVDDDVTPETFRQPSSYDSAHSDVINNLDLGPKAMAELGLSETEKGVLQNYYAMQDNLKQIQKETDISVEPMEILDYNGDPVTFLKVIPNKKLKISAFGTGLTK